METASSPGGSFANELDFQDQLDGWLTSAPTCACTRRCASARSTGVEEREVLRALPTAGPDLDRRFVVRVPAQPYVRVDTNDYSLDPELVARRVEVARLPARGPRGRARHAASSPAVTARVRRPPHDHRARARPDVRALAAASAAPTTRSSRSAIWPSMTS